MIDIGEFADKSIGESMESHRSNFSHEHSPSDVLLYPSSVNRLDTLAGFFRDLR